jgi:hypothetical protein
MAKGVLCPPVPCKPAGSVACTTVLAGPGSVTVAVRFHLAGDAVRCLAGGALGDADQQREPADQHVRADAGLESVELRPKREGRLHVQEPAFGFEALLVALGHRYRSMKVARRHDEPVYGDSSLPASATVVMTWRLGRFLNGFPLHLAVAGRELLLGALPFMGTSGDIAGGPPQYLDLQDRASGRKIARLALGRDEMDADSRRGAVEFDLERLGREQFLKKHVRAWERC